MRKIINILKWLLRPAPPGGGGSQQLYMPQPPLDGVLCCLNKKRASHLLGQSHLRNSTDHLRYHDKSLVPWTQEHVSSIAISHLHWCWFHREVAYFSWFVGWGNLEFCWLLTFFRTSGQALSAETLLVDWSTCPASLYSSLRRRNIGSQTTFNRNHSGNSSGHCNSKIESWGQRRVASVCSGKRNGFRLQSIYRSWVSAMVRKGKL